MTDHADTVAIVLAAGSSSRMGGADKIWADLGGRPVLAHSLAVFAAMPRVARLVVVAPPERHEAIRALAPAGAALVCVAGGARRQDSVAAGLAAAGEAAFVLVHDGARPLVTAEVAARVLEAAERDGAAIPVVAVVDTIKRVDADGRVLETVDRAALRAVQTPQGFAAAVLRRAHLEVTEDATDDASMVERLGLPVATVPGDPENLKVTTPADLVLARAWLAERER